MRRELEHYNEIKDRLEDQNKTLAILFEKGIVDEAGQIIQ